MSAMATPSASNRTSDDPFDRLSDAATAISDAIKGGAKGNSILVGAGTPSNEQDETIGLLAPKNVLLGVTTLMPYFADLLKMYVSAQPRKTQHSSSLVEICH
ncbi:hypothetical protein LMH87_002682 [Akanthomyces muscarius]|uniref:Uncharacterized protein n=1 Tax=Akanthomyces muscarius TaxID=2231603 RepID=A0A9W8Q6S6_AKAMU|nr:hypothetical protein LMH87_002682 [Akanthomyces muscarius]KAJ4148202.1 hypothetical protein LMH87_002682 [Akanthomyces muscarius]